MRRRIRPFRSGFRGARGRFRPGFRRPALRTRSAFRPTRRIIRRRGRRLLIGTGLVVLLFGGRAIKLRQEDLDRIEGHAGRSADSLAAEELIAAMETLNIERLELTEKEAILVEAIIVRRIIPISCQQCGAPTHNAQGARDGGQPAACLYCGTPF